MAHNYYHCGSVGTVEREITIKIKDATRLNVAIAFKTDGIDHDEAEKMNRKLKQLVQKMYDIVQQPGESVAYHYPHPDNLKLHDG